MVRRDAARATIAAATVHRPPLTVADEPTSALDTELADDILTALRQASQALLLVSHDLHLVARHSDRVAVMHAGRIVETGPTAALLERPAPPVHPGPARGHACDPADHRSGRYPAPRRC